MRANNCSGSGGTSPGSMDVFDKLPKGMREALRNSDHNWNGEQLYRAFKRRHPAVATTARAINFIRQSDAQKHVKDTADFYFGVMPGQREVAS